MPELRTVGFFLLAALVLLLIPGPAVLNIVTCSVAQGRRAGLACVLGTQLASFIHAAAAAVGLSALLMASAVAFSVVKYLGATYLIYLGARALLSREESERVAGWARKSFSQLFAQGFVVNLLNPKTALFFLAFLPQFVDPARGAAANQILVFGALFVMLGSCTDGGYAVLAGTVGQWLKGSAQFRAARRYVTGSAYIGLGLTAAFASAGKK